MMRDADRFGYGHRIRLVGEGPDVSPRQEHPGRHYWSSLPQQISG